MITLSCKMASCFHLFINSSRFIRNRDIEIERRDMMQNTVALDGFYY